MRRREILVGVVGDEPDRPADLRHHGVAGVDAQAALDAVHLQPVTDVDAGRAGGDALAAVDAVAGGRPLARRAALLLAEAARLAAVVRGR